MAHLYEEVGARVPELLRGMFAFAVWDARAGTLLLARDRFGEKPLYYSDRADGFVFASELGALLVADARTSATMSLAALDAYLALQYVPARRRSSSEIQKLPPGTLLEVRCGQRPARAGTTGASFAPDAGRARRGRGGAAGARDRRGRRAARA